MDRNASILACSLRAMSHEQLAVLAANLAAGLSNIAMFKEYNHFSESWCRQAVEMADTALRDSCVESVQAFSPDYVPYEPQPPELSDPQVNEDELADRAASIHEALDAAYNQGYDNYGTRGASREDAQHWESPKLIAAFEQGWDLAAQEDEALA